MKGTRKIASLLAIQMLAMLSVVPIGNAQAQITSDGLLKPGYRLSVEDAQSGEYQWYRSETLEGEGTLIEGATERTYTLVNADGGKYIKCDITADGETIDSAVSAQIDMPLESGFGKKDTNLLTLGMPKVTPAENVFYIEDKSWILLETSEDKESSFFLYANDNYGKRKWNGSSVKFDTGKIGVDNGIMPGYLNVTLFNNFPQGLKDSIDQNHVWLTDGKAASCPNDYTFKCGVTLISYNELMNNFNKIGSSVGDYAYLRSANADATLLSLRSGGSLSHSGLTDASATIRPAVWIGEDFFRDNYINIETMGKNVRQIIVERYDKSELTQYSEDELEELGYVDSKIEGKLVPGYTLTARHKNSGTYQWYRLESPEDEGILIEGATSDTYTLVNADGEKYLKFTVSKDGKVVDRLVSAQVAAPLERVWSKGTVLRNNGMPENAPVENVFVLEDAPDQPWILLESAKDKDSAFYLYANKSYAQRPWYGSTEKFDTGKIGGNNGVMPDYLNTTVYNTFPDALKSSINQNHVWLTEGGTTNCPDDYTFTCGVALLSLKELRAHVQKIGYKDTNYAVLRTASVEKCMLAYCSDGTMQHVGIADNASQIRPAIWVSEDLFKTAKLDLDKTGENVKAALRTRYAKSELAGLYNEEELAKLQYDQEGVKVYHFDYTNAKGKSIDSLADAKGKIAVSALFASYTEDADVTMILAVYNKDGDLVKVEMEKKSVLTGGEAELNASIDLSDAGVGDGWSARTFFWKDFSRMKPYTPSYPLNF